MSTIIALPFVCSAAVGGAALLWCRGFMPLVATGFGAAAVWMLA